MPVRVAHLVLVAVLLVCARYAAPGAIAFWQEYRDFVPRQWTVVRPPDAAPLHVADVAFPAHKGTLIRGWYVASRNGAAVVLCQGSASDRTAMWDEARAFAAAGFGVLVFDWPGHGASEGRVVYGIPERAALAGAIDFLVTRPDVDPARIAAMGFSMGAWTVVQVAAGDERIRAVVLEAPFGDAVIQTRRAYEPRGPVAVWGALLALRVAHMPTDEMRPIDVVQRIAPRSFLVVSGSHDATVPTDLSRELFDAAREPKDFWLVAGAGHGGYSAADPSYHARLTAYVGRALPATPRVTTPSAVAGGR